MKKMLSITLLQKLKRQFKKLDYNTFEEQSISSNFFITNII